jgi:hypothetical protein
MSNKIKSFFINILTTKYEFMTFEGNQIMVDRDVKQLQEEGWELAGEIKTKYNEYGYHRMLIPLKRKLS